MWDVKASRSAGSENLVRFGELVARNRAGRRHIRAGCEGGMGKSGILAFSSRGRVDFVTHMEERGAPCITNSFFETRRGNDRRRLSENFADVRIVCVCVCARAHTSRHLHFSIFESVRLTCVSRNFYEREEGERESDSLPQLSGRLPPWSSAKCAELIFNCEL